MSQSFFYVLGVLSILSLIPILSVDASNPNLDVSAENSQFDNHFAGSMVIEVVIRDNNIRDTDEGKGEPDVTLNGKSLRMVQATDGNWYAYFANADAAKDADSVALTGEPGQSLDFGVYCDRENTAFGIDLTESDGFFVPSSDCDGTPASNTNNVVRNPRSINTHPSIPDGQIGLDPNAWPLIQLFSFSDVTIQYNAAGGSQRVDLEYDEIPNISMSLDRDFYPQNAEVFVTVNDFQLNQDPTDEDSWTFSVVSPTTFYQAFDNSGRPAADNTNGLVDLLPYLSSLGFEKNGKLVVDPNSIIQLKPNSDQNNQSVVTDKKTSKSYTQIVTLVERGPNSGIFESFDSNDESTIGILPNAPRGNTGSIEYNENSVSILTGFSTASVSLQKPELKIGGPSTSIQPGTKIPVVLIDPDQNINSAAKEDLDVASDTSLIPTLKIGNPVTLKDSNNVKFYENSVDSLLDGNSAVSFIHDVHSERLFIDTKSLTIKEFEKISLDLGISSSNIRNILIDKSDNIGTNWLNYDLRSFQDDYGLNDFTDTEIMLYFGSLSDSSPSVTLVNAGEISSSQGFLKIDDSIVSDIFTQTGSIFLVIDFDSSDNDSTKNTGSIPSSNDLQPIVFDLFSFGLEDDGDGINNAIYRFELEETSDNSSTFEGEFEFAFSNQLNIVDPAFIGSIQPISDNIKFILTDRLVNNDAIFISYSDLSRVGLTVTVSSNSGSSIAETNSATLSSNSNSYRFGQPVTITLNDPDLNLRNDLVDVYFVINDPASENVDTVGKNDVILLEILIKDIRYKRCTIDGVEHGGLGATGFTLIETGPSSGIFEGVFKMPSKICNASGTKLISPAGGSIDAKYYDSRDSSGNPSIVSLLKNRSSIPTLEPSFALPKLSAYEIVKPTSEKIQEIVLSGTIDNHRRGIPLGVLITFPDGQSQNFAANLSNNGSYRSLISVNSDSLTGRYDIHLSYNGVFVGSTSFQILNPEIPVWVKNNAHSWSSSSLTDSEFANNLEYLIEQGIIDVSSKERFSVSEKTIPAWLKNNAKWWYANQISDDDFVQSVKYLVKKGIIGV
ncbi:peptidase [Nitrosopumilus sp.]|uniref:peptidase n=1 Tax=Nitrosopumilus sp. TaxID=2024843 RepID=UPI003B5ABF5D